MDVAHIPDYLLIAMREGWMKVATQKRSLIMSERILEAAFEIFSTKGYHATKIADITELAGCSVGIFYKRFGDKEGLFFTLQHRYFAASRKRYELISKADASQAISSVVRGFISRAIDTMSSNVGFIKAQVELGLTNPQIADARLENVSLATDHFLSLLVSRGMLPDQKEFRNKLRQVIRTIYATLTHIVLFGPGPYALGDKRLEDVLAEMFTDFFREEEKLREAS